MFFSVLSDSSLWWCGGEGHTCQVYVAGLTELL